jgi:hypothetical protein
MRIGRAIDPGLREYAQTRRRRSLQSMTDTLQASTDLPDRFCPGCGYNLRGITSDRCPECGLMIDPTLVATSTIPWTHRRRLGVVRAYLKTVETAVRWPSRLAREVERPVDFGDAILFRRVTATIAAAPVLLSALVALISSGVLDVSLIFTRPTAFLPELLGVPVVCAGVWLAFLAAGGVQSYWFDSRAIPPARRDRAIALSYYACGPLALTAPLALLVGLFLILIPPIERGRLPFIIDPILLVPAMLVAVVELATLWRAAVVMLQRTTHCGLARITSCGVGLPLAWAMTAAVFGIALPVAYVFVALMVLSF